jgi:hypothetical protein
MNALVKIPADLYPIYQWAQGFKGGHAQEKHAALASVIRAWFAARIADVEKGHRAEVVWNSLREHLLPVLRKHGVDCRTQ